MTRERIKIFKDQPLTLILETVTGKAVNSQITGTTDYYFNVVNRGAPAIIYLPVEGAQAIHALQPRPGEEIQIVKRQNNGDAPVFHARRVTDAVLAVPSPPDRFDEHMRNYPAGSPVPTPQPIPMQRAEPEPNGVRMLAPRSQVAPQPAPIGVPTSHPLQERMTRMFVTAAASLREAHLQLISDPFFLELEPPTWEDIRSTAVHWAISLERKEERR